MMAVALFCGVCVLGHGGGAAGGGASFSDVVDPAEIAATCRGFLVAANRTIATARWMDGQPVEGYRRVHPTMCCGLCRLRQFTCRGWSADPVTSRCWLYGTDGGGGGGTIVTKEEPGTVCGVHSKSVITYTGEVGEGGERSRRAAAMVAEGDPSPGPAARVDPAMVAQLDALPPIPHKLHIIFPHKGIVNSTTPMAMHGVRRMIELNPGWAWKVYDDDEIDKYIGQELTRPDPILTPKEVGVLQKAHPIEKTDAARLLIMWYEGGFYQDADRVYSVPMSKVISPEVKMVLPTLDIPPSFMQDVMCTVHWWPISSSSVPRLRCTRGIALTTRRPLVRSQRSRPGTQLCGDRSSCLAKSEWQCTVCTARRPNAAHSRWG
eukprot:m.150565 g.150565  ORF g.150565 m.150565 type:complete len:377 (+) comp23312_c0_seq1:208-1338(+)